MDFLLPFLSLLLLVSLGETLTRKTKSSLSDYKGFDVDVEQTVGSEPVEESAPRGASERAEVEEDFDHEFPFDDNWEDRQNLREVYPRPLLKEFDIFWKNSAARQADPRYDGEGNAKAKINLNDFERPHPLRFDADDMVEVEPFLHGGPKTHVCDNRLEIYSTVFVNANETAILYSPSFLQRRDYPNNSNCGWRIETSDLHQLSFNCSEFDIREGDYLSLKDDESSELERFVGSRRLNHITKTNGTFVVFYSNEEESGHGFNCTVTSVGKSGSVDGRQVEVEQSSRSSIGLSSKPSPIARLYENLAIKTKLPAAEFRVSLPVELLSEEVPETSETRKAMEFSADRHDSVTNESCVEQVDEEGSSVEGRLSYLKIETTSSSMHAGVYSSMVMRTVVDAMGYRSLVTQTKVNSTRVAGITTNMVEKREDGGGAPFVGSYVSDPTRSNLPGHTTTSVLESNMSSETRENIEFVSDDLTGERREKNTTLTRKSSSESTEIISSKMNMLEDVVEPTPPL